MGLTPSRPRGDDEPRPDPPERPPAAPPRPVEPGPPRGRPATGGEVGRRLCRVFGLDPALVQSIVVRAAVDEMASVEVVSLVAGSPETALTRFELVEVKPDGGGKPGEVTP